MRIALVDNGSLEAAAHESLRAAAEAIGSRCGLPVDAVSWKHSDRIPAGLLAGGPAVTLGSWVRSQAARGERELLVIPFFISAQGAIGSSLRRDLEALRDEVGGFDLSFTESLGAGTVLADIVADRVRSAAAALGATRVPVVVVDHGGPSEASAAVRNRVADAVRAALGGLAERVVAASMEMPEGPGFDFNRPLLGDLLGSPGYDRGDVVIAPLFLSPGRHAGPGGDLHQIAAEAAARSPALRCHFTELVGSHPLAIHTLARALTRALRVPSPS